MNILILCTYPITTPFHGGQLRVRNIVDTYRAAGHQVEVVGVLGSEQYHSELGFLPFPGQHNLSAIIQNPFLMEDYALGHLLTRDDAVYRRFTTLIRTKPDVIQVEQPWLFNAAQRFLSESAPSAKIIYSAHNVEWRLKNEILSSYFDFKTSSANADLVRAIEIEAIKNSNAVVCVSTADSDWVRQYTTAPVLVAPNGVKAWQTSEIGKKEAAIIVQNHPYALYCASAHPPNMQGFFEMLGGGFGSLKPDEKLIVAGGASWAIARDHRIHQSANLAARFVIGGIVSQACLEALLDDAHCILLPLTQGGGTNLKTAEALWSSKHIVATTVAMRGFERFIDSPGVHIADDPSAFKRALRSAMALPPVHVTDDELNKRRSVLWDQCLTPFTMLVESLFEDNAR